MVNNKPTGQTFTRFLPAIFVSLGLVACGSTPETPSELEPDAIVEEAPPVKAAPVVALKRDYPDRYIVKRGDTLWDLAARFLKSPWLWPEVWHINPRIRNPHLIYPGDVIVLYYDEHGKPYLTLEGAAGIAPIAPPKGINTEKRSPRIRYETIDRAINSIPRASIGPFLHRPRVVTDDDIDDAPYIVSSFEEHLISGSGNRIYANEVTNSQIGSYDIVRPGSKYEDPETGETLGYEAIRLADARVLLTGEPTTLTISKSYQEVLNGDLLLPAEEQQMEFNFFPQAPNESVTGQIISVFNGVSQIGQYNVVVLNRGKRDGLEPGHVLAIYQKGAEVRDPGAFFSFSTVQLPDERAGVVMVFRTYEKVSYALVMEATRALHVFDRVTNP